MGFLDFFKSVNELRELPKETKTFNVRKANIIILYNYLGTTETANFCVYGHCFSTRDGAPPHIVDAEIKVDKWFKLYAEQGVYPISDNTYIPCQNAISISIEYSDHFKNWEVFK